MNYPFFMFLSQHPDYDGGYLNDLALLELDGDMYDPPYIIPIQLPKQGEVGCTRYNERERERGRERERETDRQTDRQTDRKVECYYTLLWLCILSVHGVEEGCYCGGWVCQIIGVPPMFTRA